MDFNQRVLQLLKCDATDLLALKKGYNRFALQIQCDKWLALQMRRMASLSNATNGFALQCDEWLRSTNAMQPICSLYKCDVTDLLALQMRCNQFARSTNAMQPICSLYKCDATDLLALQMRCNRFARCSTNAMQPICSLYKCDAIDLLALKKGYNRFLRSTIQRDK